MYWLYIKRGAAVIEILKCSKFLQLFGSLVVHICICIVLFRRPIEAVLYAFATCQFHFNSHIAAY